MQLRNPHQMTSGSDDIVRRLIDQLESQDREHLAGAVDVSERGGEMTARLLPFLPSPSRQGQAAGEPACVLSLSDAREARARSRTVSGMFAYIARL